MDNLTYKDDPRSILIHYNQNHDPDTGQFTSSEAKSLASAIHNQASHRISQIEDDVRTAVGTTNAKMYGLTHKQKTLDSITRKIETDSYEKGVSLKDAADDIKDAIRFTTVSSDKDFVSNYREFKYQLARRGYEELRCKNYFSLYNDGKAKHKQVTSVFGDHSGYRFEVQFQTPSSLAAKEKKTKLYEEARRKDVSESRKKELETAMEKLAETVTEPVDINEIKNH